MSLGNKIKQLRQEKSWSQDELAYHAKLDGRQISRYENDKVTPSVEVVVKLAKAFDVSVDHLLFDDAPRCHLHEPASKLRSRYEITWPFISISLRLLMPLRALRWPCYFFYSGLLKRSCIWRTCRQRMRRVSCMS